MKKVLLLLLILGIIPFINFSLGDDNNGSNENISIEQEINGVQVIESNNDNTKEDSYQSLTANNSNSDYKEVFREDFDGVENITKLFALGKWTNFHAQSDTPTKSRKEITSCLKQEQCDISDLPTYFQISQEQSVSGNNSLKFVADSSGIVKSSISKQDFNFKSGDTVRFEAYYYLKSSKGIQKDIYLYDLEADSNQGYLYKGSPGRRIFLDSRNSLANDLGKWISKDTKYQKETNPFPTDRWVKINAEIELSSDKDGIIKMWQDDELIIDQNAKTLPELKSIYTSVEVGLTANLSGEAQELYIDNIRIYKK